VAPFPTPVHKLSCASPSKHSTYKTVPPYASLASLCSENCRKQNGSTAKFLVAMLLLVTNFLLQLFLGAPNDAVAELRNEETKRRLVEEWRAKTSANDFFMVITTQVTVVVTTFVGWARIVASMLLVGQPVSQSLW